MTRTTEDLRGVTVIDCVVELWAPAEFGDPERVLLGLELIERDRSTLIDCAADGASIRLSTGPSTPIDMAELGRVVVTREHPACRTLSGRRLTRVDPIIDSDNLVIGITLQTDGSDVLHIYNWGDQLSVHPSLPEAVLAELPPR